MTSLRRCRFPTSLVFFLLSAACAFAAPEDGFAGAQKIEGTHFTLHLSSPPAPSGLVRQLDIGAADKLLAGTPVEAEDSAEAELAQATDALFVRICDILDMPLFSYKGEIKVCRDEEQLARIYKNLFDKELEGPIGSFYVFDLNTIYVTQENFRRPTLGHEIGHAVISNYFVVQPPIKIQEVLAGYVEYQLRKTSP